MTLVTSASSLEADVVRAIVISVALKIDNEVRDGESEMVQHNCL
jgi:hypothetical protein